MWPFESRHDVLRVARDRLELWAWSASGWTPVGGGALSLAQFDAAALRGAATSLLRQHHGRSPSIDIVLESAWLPVLPLHPGPTLMSRSAVDRLLAHRVHSTYGPAEQGAAWQLQAEHRAGDTAGLGFALSSVVKAAVLEAAGAADRRVKSVQPAFAWGRAALRSAWPRRGWLLWRERDRTLVAWLNGGRVCALNAAAPTVSQVAQARRCVEVESVRQGVASDGAAIVVGGWGDRPAAGQMEGVTWLSVAAPPRGDMPGPTPVERVA